MKIEDRIEKAFKESNEILSNYKPLDLKEVDQFLKSSDPRQKKINQDKFSPSHRSTGEHLRLLYTAGAFKYIKNDLTGELLVELI